MAKHKNRSNASKPAPALILGTSVAQALAQPSTNVLVPPGALAVASTTTGATQAPATQANPQSQLLQLGKPYNVRSGTAYNNHASWQVVVAYLQQNGGQVTLAALQQHLQATRNHYGFAGYCLRRGYLAPVQQQ